MKVVKRAQIRTIGLNSEGYRITLYEPPEYDWVPHIPGKPFRPMAVRLIKLLPEPTYCGSFQMPSGTQWQYRWKTAARPLREVVDAATE